MRHHEVQCCRRCGRCGRKASSMTAVRACANGAVWIEAPSRCSQAEAPRVNYPTHGLTVVAVPWARRHAGHTYAR